MFNGSGPRPKEGEAGTEAVVLRQSIFAQQSGAEQSKVAMAAAGELS